MFTPDPYYDDPLEEDYSTQPDSSGSAAGGEEEQDQNQNSNLDNLNNLKDLKDKFSGSNEASGAGSEAAKDASTGVGSSGSTGTAVGTEGAAAAIEGGAGFASEGAMAAGAGGATASTAAAAGTGAAAGAGATGAAGAATVGTAGAAAPVLVAVAAAEVARDEKKRKIAIGAALAGVGLALAPLMLIFFLLMVALWHDSGSAEASPLANNCSPNTFTTFNNPAIIDRVNNNIGVYKLAAASAHIPWEMLAAVHYKETSNDATAINPYQFDPAPPEVDFATASVNAANFLQAKAQSGPIGRALRDSMNPNDAQDEQSIKDAFWGYNGRAPYQKGIAAGLGFNPDPPANQGYEGSFYVMNNWDERREGMLVVGTIDGVPLPPDTRHVPDGAWKVFILLRNATYGPDGKITQINVVCNAVPAEEAIPFGCPLAQAVVGGGNVFGTTPVWGSPNGHKGIDIHNIDGADVYATMGGTVETADTDNGVILLVNGPYKTRYVHMYEDLRVAVGDRVGRGQVIGRQDSNGQYVEGSHLHYEVWKDGVPVDPTPYVPMANTPEGRCNR